MEERKELLTVESIRNRVYAIRGQQVMLDSDLAEIYGYELKAMNQQVKRNIKRFPEDFMFQLTREEVELVLSRLAGNNFAAMQEAADWAVGKGIADGSNPSDSVTREQFVTLMWRTLGSPTSSYDLSKYTDSSRVSDWAKEAMAWAVETGLVSDTSATELSPAATATRAQIATIFARYLDK